jgi:hypothetical protein
MIKTALEYLLLRILYCNLKNRADVHAVSKIMYCMYVRAGQ